MATATVEVTVEADANYTKLHNGSKGNSGEPPSGSEVDIYSISINGIPLFPNADTVKLQEEFHKIVKKEIYINFPYFEGMNAPDSD
jgi:hypothetical protein